MSIEVLEGLAVSGNLSVGEVADRAGVAPSAVRFYEKHGLIHAERTSGNQRRFPEATPCVIKIARVAQRVGLTVREIVEVFDRLPEAPQIEDFVFLERTLVAEAETRIAALKKVMAELGTAERLCEIDDPRT